MEEIIEKIEELITPEIAETSVETEIIPEIEENSIIEERLETRAFCDNCEGKGTINEGHKICPICNGDCFK